MQVFVKLLGKQKEVNITLEGRDTSVDFLKGRVQEELLVPISQQRLVFRGKTLQDGTCISEYGIVEGSKLHLAVKKQEQATNPLAIDQSIDDEIFAILRKYFQSDSDTRLVVNGFKASIEKRLSTLSLDDIERICKNLNLTDTVIF